MTARSRESAQGRRGELPGALGPLLRLPYQAWVNRRHEALAAAGYSEIRSVHGLVFQHLPPGGVNVTDARCPASNFAPPFSGEVVRDRPTTGTGVGRSAPGAGVAAGQGG